MAGPVSQPSGIGRLPPSLSDPAALPGTSFVLPQAMPVSRSEAPQTSSETLLGRREPYRSPFSVADAYSRALNLQVDVPFPRPPGSEVEGLGGPSDLRQWYAIT
eukprot:CAMPEP_0182936570 /NCGR_PEP_ID=MMETSP0105_2-20130417/40469_1 /TAXON_ID=81532 ORGANISM="Acanthoeca-like sp., Strain 10tr" /NCGR_SAMPLE_ID=MMETSP0105_2 /ASSEMBLY_ACC=CAM_ASM_000205 /LENGTH=103 /DNA_ID=CAMNT_0025075679 /DNA_START=106 /DNA_END=418 /DNA_ORIENTATION=-